MIASHAPLKIFKLSRPLKRPRRNGRQRSLSVLVVKMYSLTQAFKNIIVSMINNKIMAKLMSHLHTVRKLATSNVYSAKLVNTSNRKWKVLINLVTNGLTTMGKRP